MTCVLDSPVITNRFLKLSDVDGKAGDAEASFHGVFIARTGFPRNEAETLQADLFLFEREVFRYFELNIGP
jgi:hypothetical protein